MKSVFSRQMALITTLILLTLTLLGGVLQVAITSYMAGQKEKTLSGNAAAVAELTAAYASVDQLGSWDYLMSIHLAAEMADADTVICRPDGRVLFCACGDFACPNLDAQLPREYVQVVLEEGQHYSTGTLPGLYREKRYIQALRLTDPSGTPLGLVVVSSPAESTSAFLRGLFRVFFYTALLVWLVAVAGSFIISRHEARPMKELVRTVGRFGRGELSARVAVGGGNTTEMDELAAAFNNMAETLEKADRRRTEFIANVSHELKTPMTSIAGYLDGMLDGTIPPEQHPRYMQIVSDEVRRLSRLVRNMLEISRMQAEGLDESRLTRFDLGETAGQTLLSFEQKIRDRRLDVQVDLPDRPVYTVAHRDAVTQVIYNLVDNAVKFCSDCGVLTLSVRPVDGKLQVTVKNTGPVIPAEELPLIFDRFHKLDKSRSRDKEGVGLGLYIVKQIIGVHGEDIWVESHDGVTAFTFTMPWAR